MAEFTTVNSGQTLHYQGYLDFARFWRLVRELLEKRGYQYLEQEQNELVKKDGKHIHIHVDCDKPVSEYAKLRLVITLTTKNLRTVKIRREEEEERETNEAEITLRAEAYVITDYEGRYQKNAWMFFIRTMAEKFLYERELKKFSHLVQRDLQDVLKEAKKYLNVFSA